MSICIPTYRRPAKLSRTLEALASLDPPSGDMEVVVADDGSPEQAEIERIVAAATETAPFPIRLVRLNVNRGPGAARNEAWRAAAGEWIVFTDDDCVATPGWLVALATATRQPGVAVVQGRTLPHPDESHLLSRPFAHSVRVEAFSDYFETCNMAYRRALLEELDGFDEEFRLIADDSDLGWRARERGAGIVFAPDALVYHEVAIRDWKADFRSRRRWADVVRMVRLHPESRRLAWRPYIFRPAHAVPLVLVGTLPLSVMRRGRLGWLALLGLVVASDLSRATDSEAAWTKLVKRIGDTYEMLLLARASLQQRTVLL